jgi:hypothetical protein
MEEIQEAKARGEVPLIQGNAKGNKGNKREARPAREAGPMGREIIVDIRHLWPVEKMNAREIRGPYHIREMMYGVHPFWKLPHDIVGIISSYASPNRHWDTLWPAWPDMEMSDFVDLRAALQITTRGSLGEKWNTILFWKRQQMERSLERWARVWDNYHICVGGTVRLLRIGAGRDRIWRDMREAQQQVEQQMFWAQEEMLHLDRCWALW